MRSRARSRSSSPTSASAEISRSCTTRSRASAATASRSRRSATQLKLPFREDRRDRSRRQGPDGKPAIEHAEWQTHRRTAFSQAPGIEREAVELQTAATPGSTWLGRTPERQKPFEEVKAEVKTQWLEAESARRSSAAAAQAIVGKIDARRRTSESAGQASKAPRSRAPSPSSATRRRRCSRRAPCSRPSRLPRAAPPPSPTPDGKARSICRVTDITPAPAPTRSRPTSVKPSLPRQMQGDVLAEYVGALQTRYGVSVNQTVLKPHARRSTTSSPRPTGRMEP